MGTHKEKPIFRGLTIAAAGDLGGGQWTDASVARWVELRAGKFVRETDDWDAVTHLVCSADEFKRMGATGAFFSSLLPPPLFCCLLEGTKCELSSLIIPNMRPDSQSGAQTAEDVPDRDQGLARGFDAQAEAAARGAVFASDGAEEGAPTREEADAPC